MPTARLQLIGIFLKNAARYQFASWFYISIGIRKAQDVGAHRRKLYGGPNAPPTTDEELWKRAFWLLVAFDRVGSASMGRPPCLELDQ